MDNEAARIAQKAFEEGYKEIKNQCSKNNLAPEKQHRAEYVTQYIFDQYKDEPEYAEILGGILANVISEITLTRAKINPFGISPFASNQYESLFQILAIISGRSDAFQSNYISNINALKSLFTQVTRKKTDAVGNGVVTALLGSLGVPKDLSENIISGFESLTPIQKDELKKIMIEKILSPQRNGPVSGAGWVMDEINRITGKNVNEDKDKKNGT